MDTWRSDIFFSVGGAATSKWTHVEVAVFGSTVYKIFALKCQKLRTPLASLAPCVIKFLVYKYIDPHDRETWRKKIKDSLVLPIPDPGTTTAP